jgi:putative transposase
MGSKKMGKQDIKHESMHLPNRRSIRLKGYDYSQPGGYFVTICTKNHAPIFGGIRDGEMVLNEIGQIASEEWQKSIHIRKEIKLDAWVVMPNHIHGIVIITQGEDVDVGAHGRAPLPYPRRSPRSLGSFIAGFKSSVTKRINKLRNTPGQPVWQRNYYEHIIRNEDDLGITRQYIARNPIQWDLDRYHPKATRSDPKVARR